VAQRTIDDIYEKVVTIKDELDEPAPQGDAAPVKTGHFNTKVKELKKAIEDGPTKKKQEGEEEKKEKGWWDLVKEWAPVKAFLEVGNGTDFFAKAILMLTAIGAGITALGALLATIGIQFNLGELVKRITLAITGRSRKRFVAGERYTPEQRQANRRYLGSGPTGFGWQREENTTQAQDPNLPSVEQINAVRDAMGRLNAEVGTYRNKVRGLATPRAMRQMASAAKKLESAAKNHQNVSGLAGSIGNLNREMRELAATAG
jgi:hypothetical protein